MQNVCAEAETLLYHLRNHSDLIDLPSSFCSSISIFTKCIAKTLIPFECAPLIMFPDVEFVVPEVFHFSALLRRLSASRHSMCFFHSHADTPHLNAAACCLILLMTENCNATSY